MRQLIALRPVLYLAHQYGTGESLPMNDPEMTKLWIDAGTAIWKEETEPEKPDAKAIPVTATPGMPGMSSSGADDLVGRIPETPARKAGRARTKTGTTKTGGAKRKTQ